MRFQGKVTLVTGGHSGVGQAIARRHAAEGARVFTAQRGKDREAEGIEADLADWERTLRVNLTAPFLLIKAALPHLRGFRGAIVNIGSIEGLGSNPRHAAYSASKAGLHG